MSNEHCIVVNEEMMTSVPGVFAAGDVLCTNIKQAVIAAADGVKAALAVDKFLNKKAKNYLPVVGVVYTIKAYDKR